MSDPIYLDYNATTPVASEVAAGVLSPQLKINTDGRTHHSGARDRTVDGVRAACNRLYQCQLAGERVRRFEPWVMGVPGIGR